MTGAENDPRKFIIGWFRCRPGKRDELMSLAMSYAANCRQEEGCLFFEMNPCLEDSDSVSVVECFSSEEAHAAHLETAHAQTFFAEIPRLCQDGKFHHIFPARVISESPTFSE